MTNDMQAFSLFVLMIWSTGKKPAAHWSNCFLCILVHFTLVSTGINQSVHSIYKISTNHIYHTNLSSIADWAISSPVIILGQLIFTIRVGFHGKKEWRYFDIAKKQTMYAQNERIYYLYDRRPTLLISKYFAEFFQVFYEHFLLHKNTEFLKIRPPVVQSDKSSWFRYPWFKHTVPECCRESG